MKLSTDIDECLNTNECSNTQICINTIGSYECHCKKGYKEDGNSSCIGEMLFSL